MKRFEFDIAIVQYATVKIETESLKDATDSVKKLNTEGVEININSIAMKYSEVLITKASVIEDEVVS